MNRSRVKAKSDQFKVKKAKKEMLKSKWQAISLGGKLFMLSSIAVLLSYKILDNTISVFYFSLIYGSVGVLVYLILKFFFRGSKSLKFDAWGYPGSFLIFASLCALLNYATLKRVIKVKYIVIDKKAESSSKAGSRACYIFFNEDGKVQRFTINRASWNSIGEGEKVKMFYQESLLGFDIVKEFAK